MTPITALGSRYGIQGALGRSVKRASSASTWWDLGGTITSCVAAYQPKGAADLAASYVNLANPGTYDLAPDGSPSFNTNDGIIIPSGEYVYSTITESLSASSFTALLRMKDRTGNHTAGNIPRDTGLRWYLLYGVMQFSGTESSANYNSYTDFFTGVHGDNTTYNVIYHSGQLTNPKTITPITSSSNVFGFNKDGNYLGSGITLEAAAFYKSALSQSDIYTIRDLVMAL